MQANKAHRDPFILSEMELPACRMNTLGTHWTVCGAPSDEPCMCNVVIRAIPDGTDPDDFSDTEPTDPPRAADPQNDVCWSCGDQLSTPTPGPALCGACHEAGEMWPEIKPTLQSALDPSPSPSDDPIEERPAQDDDYDPQTDKRCPTCRDDGRLCWDCGSLDQPAIGRKIRYLMKNDRPTLLRILGGTPRNQWYLLAKNYVTALGVEDASQMVPVLGVVSLWGMLVKEAAA